VPADSGRTFLATGTVPDTAAQPEFMAEAATSPLPKDFARRVVYSGTMSLAVFNRSTAQTRVEALVRDAGGYVQSLQEGQMVVRIPALQFREVAQKIGELGRVKAQSLEALDVTEDYYDLRTRIEVLQRTQTQLLTLLERARTVSEALEVRSALDAVTLQLEAALGKQRLLSSQVELSALSLERRLPDTDTPSSNDPFPWVDDISDYRYVTQLAGRQEEYAGVASGVPGLFQRLEPGGCKAGKSSVCRAATRAAKAP